ncbi:MAG TPA: hypothetical protein VG755_06275 [Nannocystaceae bacterium]|nr:hypothetical protein [Nannocystaceae bacterium]
MSFAHRWTPRLALLLACATLPAASANADEAAATTEETRSIASVKVELKQPSGKVLKVDGAILDWGGDGEIQFKYDDHVHDVALRVDRPNDKDKLIKLTVGYSKDGRAVIEPHTVDSEIKKREVIRIDGGIALAITVTPKNVKVDGDGEPIEEPPEEVAPEKPKEKPKAPPAEQPKEDDPPPKPKKKKLEGGGGSDDPLDGLK